MHISKLRVRNFKNLYNNIFYFDSHINTIIGENGTGKTNIFQAIRLAIDNDYKMYFSEELLSNKVVKEKGHWIIITIEFTDISDSVEEVHLKPKEDGTGTYSVMYRPKKEIRNNLYDFSQRLSESDSKDNEELIKNEIRDYIDRIDYKDDYEVIRTVTEMFDFNNDEQYRLMIGDFDNFVFPNPDTHSNKIIFGNSDQGFAHYVDVTFIPAIRNVTAELTGDNNFLTRILKALTGKIRTEDWSQFENSIKAVNEGLGEISQFTEFIRDVDSTTNRTVGSLYTTNVELKMEIPTSKDGLVKYFNLKGREEEKSINLYNRSLGDNNIIYFALKLVESTMQFGHTNKVLKIMLIEEPEAHIHKFLQESLFSGLKDNPDYQLFLSTHSVHISESSNISTMTILDKKENYVISYQPSKNLDNNEIEYLERYLDATKTSILFSKNVCIVEGTAELLMIPKLYELIYGLKFSKYGISIHSIDGSYMKGISMLFHNDRIQKYTSIITDGDKDIEVENSEKEMSSKKRIESLKSIHSQNMFIKVTNSEYTFEIDFYSINQGILKKFVQETGIYTNKHIIDEFDSKDKIILHKRILKLCDTVGKGWLAYRFIEWLEVHSIYIEALSIPIYINEAIAFLIKNLLTKNELEMFIKQISIYQEKVNNYFDDFINYLELI